MDRVIRNKINNTIVNVNDVNEVNTKTKIPGILLFQCIVISLLIVVGLAHKWATVLAVLVSCFLIVKNDMTKSILILFFVLPFSNIFKFDPSDMSMFTALSTISIIKLLYKQSTLNIKPVIMIFIFGFYLFCFSGLNGITSSLSLISSCILMYLVFSMKSKLDLKNIIIFFSIGILISSIFGIFRDKIPQLRYYMDYVNVHMSEFESLARFSGLTSNANYYTLDITIVLCGLIVLFINRTIKNSFYIIGAAVSVFGLMAVSKSFLITLGFIVLIYLFVSAKTDIQVFLKSLFFIAILSIAIYLFLDSEYIKAYVLRINLDLSSGFQLSEVTTNRTHIWETYWDYLYSNFYYLFFGTGVGSIDINDKTTHNYYLEMIYKLGIVGSSVYIFTILTIFVYNRDKIKRSIINFIPLVFLLVRGVAIGMLFYENLYYYFIIVYLVLNSEINLNFSKNKI